MNLFYNSKIIVEITSIKLLRYALTTDIQTAIMIHNMNTHPTNSIRL